MSEKIYVFKRFERLWHWSQASLIIFMLITGFEVHGSYHFFGFGEAVSYGKQRVMFNKPIAAFQLQQARLAQMLTEITKAQLLCLQLGRLKDKGTMRPQQISLAKRNNVNMACECAREARRLLGANGILAEYSAMRHMANLESVYTYEGTHDVHTLVIGMAETGMNAFGG